MHGPAASPAVLQDYLHDAQLSSDYSDSDHDSGTEGGGVEEDPELVSEEEEDMDEFSADPSQW